MKYSLKILTVITVLAMAGCITNGIAVRAISDPQSTLSKQSPVFVDALTDVSIEYRDSFQVANQIAESVGINVVERDQAQFIVRLNYRRGLRYNPGKDEFRQELVYHSSANGTKIGNSGRDYGVINAGVFSTNTEKIRSEWECSVEVNDMNDPQELQMSLQRLFEKFAEDFKGDVPGNTAE